MELLLITVAIMYLDENHETYYSLKVVAVVEVHMQGSLNTSQISHVLLPVILHFGY